LPKLRLVVLRVAPAVVPVPLRLTVCGLLLALSVSVRVAVREPVAVGANVTLITQVPLAATEELVLQVVPLAMAKSPGLVPPNAMLVKVNDAVPLLVTVTALAVLVVPTA
jgi:hypothetical protein